MLLCSLSLLSCPLLQVVAHLVLGRLLGPEEGVGAEGGGAGQLRVPANRGKRLHARNQHLRNHRGVSVAFPNRCSVSFSNIISLVSGIVQKIVTFQVDFHWDFPMDVQRHFPMDFKLCDFWCVIFAPSEGQESLRRCCGVLFRRRSGNPVRSRRACRDVAECCFSVEVGILWKTGELVKEFRNPAPLWPFQGPPLAVGPHSYRRLLYKELSLWAQTWSTSYSYGVNFSKEADPAKLSPRRFSAWSVSIEIGWHHLSNATCLHGLICSLCGYLNLLHYSPLLKNTCVRQVVLDKWFALK